MFVSRQYIINNSTYSGLTATQSFCAFLPCDLSPGTGTYSQDLFFCFLLYYLYVSLLSDCLVHMVCVVCFGVQLLLPPTSIINIRPPGEQLLLPPQTAQRPRSGIRDLRLPKLFFLCIVCIRSRRNPEARNAGPHRAKLCTVRGRTTQAPNLPSKLSFVSFVDFVNLFNSRPFN